MTSVLATASLPSFAANSSMSAFNVTAIAAVNGRSTLECWTLATPPQSFRGAVNYPMGDFTGGYIGVIQPHTYIGNAWAPYVQYSIFLAGTAHISIPNSSQEVWVQGGKYGTIIAADLKDLSATGHITDFPSNDETVIVELPFEGNETPEHTVLHDGPCCPKDLIGL